LGVHLYILHESLGNGKSIIHKTKFWQINNIAGRRLVIQTLNQKTN
jgi:hypothetical protein